MVQEFLSLFQTDFYMEFYRVVWDFAPLWIPFPLALLAFSTHLTYRRREWIKERGSVLLEIKIPKGLSKSPAAMELVLNGLIEPIVGTTFDALFKGRVRDWFSLEIVSIGGEVRFFMWVQTPWKKIVETRIYAHYPEVQVVEVEDYAKDVFFDPKTMKIFACQMGLSKADIFPIKTYIDFGLDKQNVEEEEKIDPLVPMLEFMGSLREGEQAWVQILIQAHREQEWKRDMYFFPRPQWKEQAKKEIKNIIEKEAYVQKKEEQPATLQHLTKGQTEIISAIERSVDKWPFDTMIRLVTFGDAEVYNPMNGGGIVGSFRHFGTPNAQLFNGLRPKFFAGVDHPKKDFRSKEATKLRRQLIDAYKRRSFFNVPYKHWQGKPFILSPEELATIYHFPGDIVSTPTLNRIPSKRSEAPSNLPI